MLQEVFYLNFNLGIKLITCCHRIGPTFRLFYKDPASIPLWALSIFSPGMVTSLILNVYGISAFYQGAAGLSPTEGEMKQAKQTTQFLIGSVINEESPSSSCQLTPKEFTSNVSSIQIRKWNMRSLPHLNFQNSHLQYQLWLGLVSACLVIPACFWPQSGRAGLPLARLRCGLSAGWAARLQRAGGCGAAAALVR